VRYQLKTPWKNGTTHVEFEPVEFIAKLAALVPPPRAHLTRFHGVFAPNAKLRAQLTPSRRGKRPPSNVADDKPPEPADNRSPNEKRRSMTPDQVGAGSGRNASSACYSGHPALRPPPPFGPAFRLFQIAPGDLVNIDVSTCVHCGGTLRIVAGIEEPTATRAILAHFEKHGALEKAHYRPAARAPRCARVTPRRPRRRRRNQEDNTKRQRIRREALGPLSGIGAK